MFPEAEKSYSALKVRSRILPNTLQVMAAQDSTLPEGNQTVPTNTLKVFKTNSVYPLVSITPSNI